MELYLPAIVSHRQREQERNKINNNKKKKTEKEFDVQQERRQSLLSMFPQSLQSLNQDHDRRQLEQQEEEQQRRLPEEKKDGTIEMCDAVRRRLVWVFFIYYIFGVILSLLLLSSFCVYGSLKSKCFLTLSPKKQNRP